MTTEKEALVKQRRAFDAIASLQNDAKTLGASCGDDADLLEARGIFALLALQINYHLLSFIEKHPGVLTIPPTTRGGVWPGHSDLLDEARKEQGL